VAQEGGRAPRTVARLTRNQRAQHWLLLTSFVVLVLSGFALVYPDAMLAVGLGVTEATRRLVHRVAAGLMIVVGVYHHVYRFTTAEGRAWLRDMRPVKQDARDVLRFFRHHLTGRGPRPKFRRFGYAEKAEYWAVVWGTLVMGLTGLLIWFKVGWFSFLPRWWVDIATAVHFYEAVLATLAIVVWHFYHVVFDPDVYPLNFAFYDGRVAEALYREEHELDYERMKEEEARRRQDEQADADETPPGLGGGNAPLPGHTGG
jgi:cytochrome b subunit of formate dehydrogenase